MNAPDFSDISAVYINCSIQKNKSDSHTQLLLDASARIMEKAGAKVEQIYALEHQIAFGMLKDGSEQGLDDDWPAIQKKVYDADILIIGTPIWLGAKSSVATQVVERLYAYSGDTNSKGQYSYYGKVGGVCITGNEDGAKHCAMDVLYALQHIGYTVPPQSDFAWLGEIGPGPSYGDTEFGDQKFDPPAGFDREFTNRNTTIATYNMLHMARLLKDSGGIPAYGNDGNNWQNVPHAEPQL